MKQELKIAIAGLGTVGSGVYKILTEDLELVGKRSQIKIALAAVSSRSKKDFVDERQIKFYENPLDLADDKNIDVIVETIGGSEGVALELCKKSLKNKKHFITANKAMLAIHGKELSKLAEENNVNLCFEASVCGATPVLKNIKEGLVANRIDKIFAILNGTCNYILTKMEVDDADFSDALKEAQRLGYAESDPTFDIEGIDSAHKIALLAAIAKNAYPQFEGMYIEGISKISIWDIKLAKEFGYKIKLLGVFEDLGSNKIKQFVYPSLVKNSEKISGVNGAYNAVLAHGHNANWSFQIGSGAGQMPTASAIVADIFDIANDRCSKPFGAAFGNLENVKLADIKERFGAYYLKFIADKEFAKNREFIKAIFANKEVIDSTIIEEISDSKVIYAITTISMKEEEMSSYLQKISAIKEISDVNLIRIEDSGF